VFRAADFTQVEDCLVKMPNRRWSLQACVETGRRINGTMTQHAADNFIGTGIGVEKQLGRDMAEKVRMDP
jgi:hypothetical protein